MYVELPLLEIVKSDPRFQKNYQPSLSICVVEPPTPPSAALAYEIDEEALNQLLDSIPDDLPAYWVDEEALLCVRIWDSESGISIDTESIVPQVFQTTTN